MESKCVFLENNKEKCGICYTHTLVDCNTKILECNHKLCKGCFYKLKQNNCPFCRKIIDKPKAKDFSSGSLPNNIPIRHSHQLERVSTSLPNFYHLQGSRVGRRLRRREKNGGRSKIEDMQIDMDTGRYDDEIFDFEY